MEKIVRNTKTLDANGQSLGRLATQIATILRGKDKPTFQPNVDAGDFVEVENCAKIRFTGNKLLQREYIWHTNHPGGLKREKVRDVFQRNPGEVLKKTIWNMLPKNKLRDAMIQRLKIKS